MASPKLKDSKEGKPPFFGSWNKLYAFVLAFMAALIALFVLFSNTYSR